MAPGEWVQLIAAVAALGLLVVTYHYLVATRELVAATRKQHRKSKRAWLVVEGFPLWEGRENHLLLRNYGRSPAMNVWLYHPASLFGGDQAVSWRARVNLPMRPDQLYEVAVFGPGSNKIPQREPEAVFLAGITDMDVRPDLIEPVPHPVLPEGTLVALTYQDVDGEEHWLRYFGIAGDHRQEDGDGDPPWLRTAPS